MRRVILLAFSIALALSAAAAEPMPPKVWNGDRAMADIAALLKFTPRSIGAPGHERTIAFIQTELRNTPAKTIKLQHWTYRTSEGKDLALTNIIARFDPDNPYRMIVATHYDSIVRAYADRQNPDGLMPGANNSASGVALLLETARALAPLPAPPLGIDMIFFDGEEGPKSLGAGDPAWMALGSPYFAAHLDDVYPAQKPEKAVVFDMVCPKKLQLKPELSSLFYANAEVTKFWAIGHSFAPKIFILEPTRLPIGDDQVALAGARIPSFLVIDFDYDPWFNTTKDTLDKCSAESLDAVGRTLLDYIYAR